MNNHYAKFEKNGTKAFGVTDYTNQAPLKCCGQTDERTDGWSGPTTRPAFAKATQVIRLKRFMCIVIIFAASDDLKRFFAGARDGSSRLIKVAIVAGNFIGAFIFVVWSWSP